MRVEVSRGVEGDLSAIGDYIAQDNPRRAVSFVKEIRARFAIIGQNPFLYQIRGDLGSSARVAVAGNYLILFQVLGEVVRIERVVHGMRSLRDPI